MQHFQCEHIKININFSQFLIQKSPVLKRINIYLPTFLPEYHPNIIIFKNIFFSFKNIKFKNLVITIGINLSCYPRHRPQRVPTLEEEPNWRSPQTNLDKSPKSEPDLELHKQGCAKCGGTSPCQRSWNGKKFRRKADKKIYFDDF